MIALQIKSMKQFMNQLLAADTFDPFLLEEAVIGTASTFTIDGHVNREFYGDTQEPPQYEFRPWRELKGLCFDLIKGKRTPVGFKFVLHLKPELAESLLTENGSAVTLNDLKAFVLNIKYDGNDLTCVTATAFHTFIPDKMPDQIWDGYMDQFMGNNGIGYEP